MSKRWSKLQSRLYNLMDESINFQIHCALYEMNSNDGYHGSKLPRYFITIEKEIIWDYPKDFDTAQKYGFNSYPWDTDISTISDVIEEYIQRPYEEIMDEFEKDKWGITDILRVCDRRIGKRRLQKLKGSVKDTRLLTLINKRLGKETIYYPKIGIAHGLLL